MKIEELKEELKERGFENVSVFFDNPSYEKAIIGISTNGNVCYDYDKMVNSLVKEGMTTDEARDFINCNTIRLIECEEFLCHEEKRFPIVIFPC